MRILILAATLCVGVALGQKYPSTTPVPILKQINRHNEDGSYSYGFEAADGSYKIESKYPNGEVQGKYGFVDDTGSVHEIEYGASRRGFEPTGTGINVPPATVNSNSIADGKDDPDDDGQYREDPAIYYTDPKYTNGERYDPVPKTPIYSHQLQQRPLAYSPAAPSRVAASAYRPAPALAPAPAPAPAPAQAAQYPNQYLAQYQAQQYQPQQYQPQQYQSPQQYQPQYQPQYTQPKAQYQLDYEPKYKTQYQPQYTQPKAQYQLDYQPKYRTQVQPQLPVAPQNNQYRGLPASPIAANSGSYSINYKR